MDLLDPSDGCVGALRGGVRDGIRVHCYGDGPASGLQRRGDVRGSPRGHGSRRHDLSIVVIGGEPGVGAGRVGGGEEIDVAVAIEDRDVGAWRGSALVLRSASSHECYIICVYKIYVHSLS